MTAAGAVMVQLDRNAIRTVVLLLRFHHTPSLRLMEQLCCW